MTSYIQVNERLSYYSHLMRLHKPVGTLLLLWPTLWALWLATSGHPNQTILVIFILGVFLMRSAGCVANDIADRHIDGYVARTQERPLAKKLVSVKEAVLLAGSLLAAAFGLVLFCNSLTIELAFIGVGLALFYPLMKRFTYMPQLGLGVAFAWSIPMAFAAETNEIPLAAWFLFLTVTIWPIIYDTMYAMVDREDDSKIGVKSTAILFADMDRLIIGLLQILFVLMMVALGLMFRLHLIYYISLGVVACMFIYQQWLISTRDTRQYFKAFLNNQWVGCVIFVAIVLSYTI